jgi:hypothetical protein
LRVEFGQALRIGGTDASVPLLANKATLLTVNAISNASGVAPAAASASVLSSAGHVLQTVALTPPSTGTIADRWADRRWCVEPFAGRVFPGRST